MTGKSGPCRTPGAIYETKLTEKSFGLKVMFPRLVIAELTSAERQELITEIHAAIIPVMEKLYSRVWDELFAGKPLTGHSREMPLHHDEL